MDKNISFCKKEHIEISAKSLKSNEKDIKQALKDSLNVLLNDPKVDVLWVLNDNILITKEILTDVWLPALSTKKIPVIVGTEILANPATVNLGTFAVVPDNVSLGTQTLQMIQNIRDENWDAGSTVVQQPLSVYKVMNMKQAGKKFHLSEDKLSGVDKMLK